MKTAPSMVDPECTENGATGQHDGDLAQLAGTFIHEIKNQIGTVALNLELLEEELGVAPSPEKRRALARVQKLRSQCRQLVMVANDFLRFARVRNLKREATDLATIVDEMTDFVGPTAAAKGIRIKTFLAPDIPPIPLDRDLFRQALLNILLNAEQAMPEGGSITIQASMACDETRRQPTVLLQVIDTGHGIPADALERIFEPFYSTKENGNGLGLPTTKRIVEAHGGSIAVETSSGRGTCVTVQLPVSEPSTPVEA